MRAEVSGQSGLWGSRYLMLVVTTLGYVGELSVQDPQFRQWWAAHHVASIGIGTKTLHHAIVGDMALDWDTLTSAADPEQQLIVWTAESGTPSHQALRILASWAANEHQPTQASPGSTA